MGKAIGVYVHWPWCERICPYCDFNVHLPGGIDPVRLATAIGEELDVWADRLGPRPVGSVYFGGGTPSLAPPEALALILGTITERFVLFRDAEITIEVNPEHAERFADLAAIGANRVSLGVQSLRDAQLRFLGRRHDAAAALRALALARSSFRSVSVDMIYALPGQNIGDWSGELDDLLARSPDHASLYMLEIPRRTRFGQRVGDGSLTPLDEDDAAEFYNLTRERTDAAGLPAYEISNHATSPRSRSRHNLLYWRGGEWLGVGPGAHGRIGLNGVRHATQTVRSPREYAARKPERRTVSQIALDDGERARERLAMGLRVAEGLPVNELDPLVPDAVVLGELAAMGLLETDADKLALTARGRPLADTITAHLLESATGTKTSPPDISRIVRT